MRAEAIASSDAVTRVEVSQSQLVTERRARCAQWGVEEPELKGTVPTHVRLERLLDDAAKLVGATSSGWSAKPHKNGWAITGYVTHADGSQQTVAFAFRADIRDGLRALLGELFILEGELAAVRS